MIYSIPHTVIFKPSKEVRIKTPWGGHIAGKWYGPKNIAPIVMVILIR